MRKPIVIITAVVIVALLGAGIELYRELRRAKSDYSALQVNSQATQTRYETAINEIAAIQDSLNAIILGEEGAQALATALEAERGLSQSRGDEARARIAAIKAGIERARDRVQALEAQVEAAGVQMAGLTNMIANLRQSLAERETLVAQLTSRVDELQTQVTGLSEAVAHNQQTIEVQEETIQAQAAELEDTRRTMGTVFYAIGSKNDLKAAGVIESSGGVLGLGQTLKPSGRFEQAQFMTLDTDQESVIRIPASKARVLSTQPHSSYELAPVEERMELRILDPEAFRAVKHVIIVAG